MVSYFSTIPEGSQDEPDFFAPDSATPDLATPCLELQPHVPDQKTWVSAGVSLPRMRVGFHPLNMRYYYCLPDSCRGR